MPMLTYAQALVAPLHASAERDPSLNFFGTSFLLGPGNRAPQLEQLRELYPDRNHDAPISESALALLATGAAICGTRMFVHFGRATFALEAWSQLLGETAILHYSSGGQLHVPLVMHGFHGVFPVESAQHCGSPQAMLWNSPGLQIALPSTPADARDLMAAALADDNPTFVLSHTALLGIEGDVPLSPGPGLGHARVLRRGRDVTIVATSFMVQLALRAAELLAGHGIDAEVVDPRTLVPFDWDTVLESIRRTGRLLVVDETHRSCGVASEIVATASERAWRELRAPPLRAVREDLHVPYSNAIKSHFVPTVETIIAAARTLVGS